MELQVEKFLKEKGIGYRLIKLSQKAYTVDDVAERGVNPEEICKTIIMRGRKSDKIAAVLLKGGDMINFSEAKKLFGEEMALATREQVKEAAGVEPGAVCPFLLTVSLLVDVKVMDLKRMNCGSGDHLYGLEIGTKDFAKVVEHKIVALAKTSVF